MSLIKVANPRDSSEYGRLPASIDGQDTTNTTATTTTTTANMTETNIQGGSQIFRPAQILSLEQLQQQQQQQQEANYLWSAAAGAATPMFSGYSQSREMSAMVTALTHVVSGQRSGEWGYNRPDLSGSVTMSFGAGGSVFHSANSPSSAYSSSSSGSWAGQKRGRDQEETISGCPESVQRVYKGFADFRAGESSSVRTG